MLFPRQKTPDLELATLDHGEFKLSNEQSQRGTLICFYRGYHCPLCIKYLTELDRLVPEFEKRGINVIAVSSDAKDRAELMRDKVDAKNLRFGYGLPLTEARDWGLFISTSNGKTSVGVEEPDLFAEPGLFLISPDRSLYFSSVQTMPFVRPSFREMLGALDFVIEKNYPARGEYRGEV
ncbi:AhpC/TSA family protein [Maritalea sp. P4.10X]|uniref:AhpC/TSA family protein n=2 Tax=Maritalea mediterranea TaxID=2909667 RepID=A0ABS9E9B9_9HYPH|nr:peroxiredoxin-like family protein [Maritalea mediterranea]MCF4098784.1 AhpC/TSA family protein [Maritalea mediterranea]